MRDAAAKRGLDARCAVPLLLVASLLVKNVFAYLSEFALNSIGLAMVRDLRRDAYRALLDQSTRFSVRGLLGRADEPAALGRRADPVRLRLAAGRLRAGHPDDASRPRLRLLAELPLWPWRCSWWRRCSSVPIVANFRTLRRPSLSARERIGEMGALLGETLRGHRLIKTYAMEEFEAGRFERASTGRYFARQPPDDPAAGAELAADGGPRRDRSGPRLRLRGRPDPRGADDGRGPALLSRRDHDDLQAAQGRDARPTSSSRSLWRPPERLFERHRRPRTTSSRSRTRSALPPFATRRPLRERALRLRTRSRSSTGLDLTIRRGETVALVGPVGRRQDDARQSPAAALRSDRRARHVRRRGPARRHARVAAAPDRPGDAGDDPLRHDRAGRTSPTARRSPRRGAGAGGGARGLRRRVHRAASRRATTRRSGRAEPRLSGGQRQRAGHRAGDLQGRARS